MAQYDDVITRADNAAIEVPQQVSSQIIQQLPKASAAMGLSRKATMSSKSFRQPVLSVLPDAYWVNGDTGLKQTTKQQWESVILTAEPIATLVVVPDEFFDDAMVPIWSQVRPRLVEAIGKTIDRAIFFGVNKPASWTSSSIYDLTVARGSVVYGGTGEDMAVDIASMGRMLAKDGFSLKEFVGEPGFRWRLIGLRSDDGIPIYASPSGEQPGTIFGFPIQEAANGAWDSTKTILIGGDFEHSVIGIRQDITFQIFDQAVISDADGAVVFNTMQQDAKVMRVVTRLGWATAIPTTALGDRDDTCPWVSLKLGSLPS